MDSWESAVSDWAAEAASRMSQTCDCVDVEPERKQRTRSKWPLDILRQMDLDVVDV